MTNVIPLPTARGAATRLDLFLRVGETRYGQIANLYAEGRVPLRRAIFDASVLKHQLDFLRTLRDDGVELTLDPKAAELAAPARFEGRPSGSPWADGVLHVADQFDDLRCREFSASIAREAVEKQFDRVLAPTHYLKNGVLDRWFSVDLKLCYFLREALDREGGPHIAIDYGVLIDQLKLRDGAVRAALVNQLTPLPFENIVFRVSHFGADATATSIRALINLLDDLQGFNHPILIDHVGGVVGRALLAFGAASGIAHGVDEHLRFDATPWNRPVKDAEDDETEGRRGGAAKRVSLPQFDRTLTVPELQALARAKGGHSLMVCSDRNCCRNLSDMINNSRRHSIIQETAALGRLNRIPDLIRAQHFIENELADVDRFGRQLKELKPIVSELKPRIGQTPDEAAESPCSAVDKTRGKERKIALNP